MSIFFKDYEKNYSSYSYHIINKNGLYGKWRNQVSKCNYCGLALKHANPYAKKNNGSLFCKLYHMECEQEIRYVIAKYGQKAYKLLMGELK